MEDLAKKSLLITGASRGIGRAIALHMAPKTKSIFCCARSQENLDGLKIEAGDNGDKINTISLDLMQANGAGNLLRWLAENKTIPELIITNYQIFEKILLERAFSGKENKNIIIKQAKSKEEISLSNLAEKNAKQALTQKLYDTKSNTNLIEQLTSKFNLNQNTDLIEVYDNSHIQGTNCIGALITFGNEGFEKKRYRKFNIKNESVKGNDYGMLKEVLFRRFSKAVKEKAGALSLPDLVMVDGGKGQYSVSREILNELGLHEMPVIAIAKGKNRNAGEETMFYREKIYKFKKNDPLLFFIQRLRDEAHRFAISSHRAKRKKGISKSLLDQITGIGKQRKRALLNHFGSARSVESASFDELKSVEGIEDNVAKKIYNYFHE